MKTKQLLSLLTIIIALGVGVRPSLADSGHESAHCYSLGHECCVEMMKHHAHAADHLRHPLKHQKEIGLSEEQVKKAHSRVPPANFHAYLSRLKDDAELEKTIKQGKQFLGDAQLEDTLTDEQVRVLIAYIRRAVPLAIGVPCQETECRGPENV